jgi:hypothetical protein
MPIFVVVATLTTWSILNVSTYCTLYRQTSHLIWTQEVQIFCTEYRIFQ